MCFLNPTNIFYDFFFQIFIFILWLREIFLLCIFSTIRIIHLWFLLSIYHFYGSGSIPNLAFVRSSCWFMSMVSDLVWSSLWPSLDIWANFYQGLEFFPICFYGPRSNPNLAFARTSCRFGLMVFDLLWSSLWPSLNIWENFYQDLSIDWWSIVIFIFSSELPWDFANFHWFLFSLNLLWNLEWCIFFCSSELLFAPQWEQ